jgi:hypothetical protein
LGNKHKEFSKGAVAYKSELSTLAIFILNQGLLDIYC